MGQFASDSFTNSDGTVLTTHSANWTRHSSYATDCRITDANRLRASAVGYTFHYRTETPASADYEVSADVHVLTFTGRDEQSNVLGRASTSADTCYRAGLKCWTTDEFRLTKAVAGTVTLLGSAYAVTLATSTTYAIKLTMAGSTIKAFLDGTERVSVTDTAITDAGRPGVNLGYSAASTPSNSAGFHLDNFSADESGLGTLTLSDSFSVGDSSSRAITKVLSDAFSVADTIAKNLKKTLSDALSLSDTLSTYLATVLQLSDSFTLSDSAVRRVTKALSDAFTLSDVLAKTLTLKQADAFGLGDAVTTFKLLLLQLSDAFSLSDSSTQTIQPSVAEAIILTAVEQASLRGLRAALTHFPTSYVWSGLTKSGVFGENRGNEVMLDAGYNNRRAARIVSARDAYAGLIPAKGQTITIGSDVWRIHSVTYDRVQITIDISAPRS